MLAGRIEQEQHVELTAALCRVESFEGYVPCEATLYIDG
jgi:hypothetical protein